MIALTLTLTLAMSLGAPISQAADAVQQQDYGKHIYDSKCAACHGVDGKGNGPFATNLVKKPSDLTMIAKNNKGVVPVMALEALIDGREEAFFHGTREMPVWGQELRAEAGSNWPAYMGVPFNPEVFVRGRIMALIDYIGRIQEK
jgi:mono/diheme cytochrome c family protein